MSGGSTRLPAWGASLRWCSGWLGIASALGQVLRLLGYDGFKYDLLIRILGLISGFSLFLSPLSPVVFRLWHAGGFRRRLVLVAPHRCNGVAAFLRPCHPWPSGARRVAFASAVFKFAYVQTLLLSGSAAVRPLVGEVLPGLLCIGSCSRLLGHSSLVP